MVLENSCSEPQMKITDNNANETIDMLVNDSPMSNMAKRAFAQQNLLVCENCQKSDFSSDSFARRCPHRKPNLDEIFSQGKDGEILPPVE